MTESFEGLGDALEEAMSDVTFTSMSAVDGDDDTETHILDDAKEVVYERPDTHGEPEDSFARIAALWSGYLGIDIDAEDAANLMILLKVARNKEGHYRDENYVDIAGYAENGARLYEDGG